MNAKYSDSVAADWWEGGDEDAAAVARLWSGLVQCRGGRGAVAGGGEMVDDGGHACVPIAVGVYQYLPYM